MRLYFHHQLMNIGQRLIRRPFRRGLSRQQPGAESEVSRTQGAEASAPADSSQTARESTHHNDSEDHFQLDTKDRRKTRGV
jgi:hypothetical protein